MSDFFQEPESEVSFGDVFAAEFLYDAHLRTEAAQMGTRDVPAKQGGGVVYGPQFTRKAEYVLAHGAPYRAILITDNCAVDTALGQGRGGSRPKGRLLFAPIVDAPEQDMTTGNYGRFPMPAWRDRLPGTAIAELRRCFMVDARAVAGHKDARIASLTLGARDALELRWNAYAARRGPMPNKRNAEKLAELVARAQDGPSPNVDSDLASAVAAVFLLAWRLEGRHLEAAADAQDQGRPGDTEISSLEFYLRELSEKAREAADALRAYGYSSG